MTDYTADHEDNDFDYGFDPDIDFDPDTIAIFTKSLQILGRKRPRAETPSNPRICRTL